METLRLKPRPPVEDDIEVWDDEDFMIENDDVTFRSASSSTNAPPNRRDSHSSHFSLRSELESLAGEEEQHVHLPGDDEKSTHDAIAAAASAGIPIPKNVPSSALMGGTIKRLGGRKIKKIIQDDWEHDLELPDACQGLHIKQPDQTKFPDALRQISGTLSSPTKLRSPPAIIQDDKRSSTSTIRSTVNLDRFKDTDEDDDFLGDGAATIKVSKTRSAAKPISFITPPTPSKPSKADDFDDDFEKDFEIPNDGRLKLSTRKDIPKTPSSQADDLDWGEGSLGTRYGGTRRSNRSSSSVVSPSASSSFTAESEDDTFEGLVIPTGPVDFKQMLHRRKDSRSPERSIGDDAVVVAKKSPQAEADRPDFLDDLDFGEGEIFDSGKLTNHRNLKVKENRPASPTRPKTAVSLTFTNKPLAHSRLPRPSMERAQTSLEPVSESGGPILQRNRRSQSRLGHSAQSSISSIPTPTTPSSAQSLPPSTPRRREPAPAPAPKQSLSSLRIEPTTTSAQLLRLKRSLPVMRPPQSPAKLPASRYDRPPSRTDGRPQSAMRPKTPVERSRPSTDSSAGTRKHPPPFLPAGASQSQSQHVMAKNSRVFRRHDSDHAIDLRPLSRAVSRSTTRSPSPRRRGHDEDFWSRLAKPKKSKHFGDGHELDGFDDLPTSFQAESRFIKQPVAAGAKQLRNKIYQNVLPNRTATPSPSLPYSPLRADPTPSFARDTTASRIARETALAQRAPVHGPLAPLTVQRVAQLSTRSNLNPHMPQATLRSKKSRRPPQLKPHLISNLSSSKESRVVNGMCYNPETYRWEGNENALSAFEAPVSSPSTASLPPYMVREKENATPRPALITNISTTKGVQVVGGMVFDPQHMCWLKLGPGGGGNGKSELGDPMEGFNALDDEDDVFKDIPDLEDNNNNNNKADSTEGQGRMSDIKDEWLVGEEFDVGPEFVRRQREEEERWRKKCERWTGRGTRDREAWRWTIRDLVTQPELLPL